MNSDRVAVTLRQGLRIVETDLLTLTLTLIGWQGSRVDLREACTDRPCGVTQLLDITPLASPIKP